MSEDRKQAVFMTKVDSSETFATKTQLIQSMLPHITFDGWSFLALDSASESLGLPKIVGRELFEHEEINLVAHHSRMADQSMIIALESEDLESMKVTETIRLCFETRFRQQLKDREAIRRGMSLLTLPQNSVLAAKLLYETVDAAWLIAGDTATDYNRYTKRGLLSGVYGSTVVYWLNDKSEDLEDTMTFLDRRLANVHKVFGGIGKLTKSLGKIREKFGAGEAKT